MLPHLSSEAAVIILTASRDGELHQRAMLAGARGVIHKAEPAEVILKAIARVHAGEPWLDRASLGRLLNAFATANGWAEKPPRGVGASKLTASERRVIAAMVRHKSSPSKVVAATLHISEHTLRNHLASIYSKLGIHRRVDLVLYGIEHRLGTLPS